MIKISKAITCLYVGIVAAEATEVIFDDIKKANSEYIDIKFEEKQDMLVITGVSIHDFRINPYGLNDLDTQFIRIVDDKGNTVMEEEFLEVTFKIPALTKSNKPIHVKEKAFKALQAHDLRLNLQFIATIDGSGFKKYVQLPPDCSEMFCDSDRICKIDFSGADLSKVTSADSMFKNCRGLESVIWGECDTKNINTMRAMFQNCWYLQNLDLSKFNTENVTDMSYMFDDCHNLVNLDLGSFDTKNVINMTNMFSECPRLKAHIKLITRTE